MYRHRVFFIRKGIFLRFMWYEFHSHQTKHYLVMTSSVKDGVFPMMWRLKSMGEGGGCCVVLFVVCFILNSGSSYLVDCLIYFLVHPQKPFLSDWYSQLIQAFFFSSFAKPLISVKFLCHVWIVFSEGRFPSNSLLYRLLTMVTGLQSW